jgi:NadR type nicotinamide-nucleotide adenylyltransferase
LAAKKIVVIGPESTGKSTLSAALAHVYDTLWVPEYARAYIAGLGGPYVLDDLTAIANGQVASEDDLLPHCHNLLVCDTDLNVLKVWSEHAYRVCDNKILEQIATRQYDLYLLTYTDVAWEYDPQREHGAPDMRAYFYHQYRDIVMNSGVPWADIRGTYEERLQASVHIVNKIL